MPGRSIVWGLGMHRNKSSMGVRRFILICELLVCVPVHPQKWDDQSQFVTQMAVGRGTHQMYVCVGGVRHAMHKVPDLW
jgi:hypothetical protein